MPGVELNQNEMDDYASHIFPVIVHASLGTHLNYPDDFFEKRTASPRLGRYLFEQVDHGNLKGTLRCLGSRSKDGYVKL